MGIPMLIRCNIYIEIPPLAFIIHDTDHLTHHIIVFLSFVTDVRFVLTPE